MKSAKAAMFGFSYSYGDYKQDDLGKIEAKIEDDAELFNKDSKHINVYVFSQNGLRESFQGDMTNDLNLV